MQGGIPVYCPKEWLVGQAAGQSNISGRKPPKKFWPSAEKESSANQIAKEVVAVVGPFRGGTSCVAGMLHNLGVSMGHQFLPPNKNNPRGFFEAVALRSLCHRSYAEPRMTPKTNEERRVAGLRRWARWRHGKIIGAKHPTLSMMVPDMVKAWPNLRVVAVERPVEESIQSIVARGWWKRPMAESVLPKMIATRDSDLERLGVKTLRLSYHNVITNPTSAVEQLIAFCEIKPTDAQRKAAIAFVKPDLQHFTTQ